MGSLLNLIISRPAEVYSASTNDTNLVKTIEKFWKIQSIGNKEQALQEWENSLNTNVSYKNDRHEIHIQRMKERLSDHYYLTYIRVFDGLRLNYEGSLDKGIIERIPEHEINLSKKVH